MSVNFAILFAYLIIIFNIIAINVNGQSQDSNDTNNVPKNTDDAMFEGEYKSVKGGVGAAFTEAENWDGLKSTDKVAPPDFKTEGMPSMEKQADDFEKNMQKEESEKATMNLPTSVKNFHDASSNSLAEEQKWEKSQNPAPIDPKQRDQNPLPPPKINVDNAPLSSSNNRNLRNNKL